MSRTTLIVFLAWVFLLPCSADGVAHSPLDSPDAAAPLPLVVDTDMGMDDLRAIALLLESPRVRILGLTTVFGSTGPGKGAANLARLLATLEKRPLPLSAGADEPLAGGFDKPPWRPMCEAVGGALWGPGEQVVLHEPAARLIARLVRKGEGKAAVLCLGPLTNLARALEEDPGLAAAIHTLVVACAGTADGEPHFNLAADPVAAEQVLRAPIGRIVFVPAPRGEGAIDFARAMAALREERIETPAARAVSRIFGSGQAAELLAAGHFLLGDDLAALYLLRPALFALDGPFCATVETRGPGRGRIGRLESGAAVSPPGSRRTGVGDGQRGRTESGGSAVAGRDDAPSGGRESNTKDAGAPGQAPPPASAAELAGSRCTVSEARPSASAGRITRTLVDSLAGLLPPADPPAFPGGDAGGLVAGGGAAMGVGSPESAEGLSTPEAAGGPDEPGAGSGVPRELEASILRSFPPLAPDRYQDDAAEIVTAAVTRHGAAEWRGVVLATEMHGHLGIYSLIGVKMGLRALEILGAPRAEVEVTPHCGSEPPLSCLQDGLMAATGATPGRGLLLPSTSPRVTLSAFGPEAAPPGGGASLPDTAPGKEAGEQAVPPGGSTGGSAGVVGGEQIAPQGSSTGGLVPAAASEASAAFGRQAGGAAALLEPSPLSATFAYGEREVTLILRPEVAQRVAGQLAELLQRHGGRQDADYFREVRAEALRLNLELDRDWIFLARK